MARLISPVTDNKDKKNTYSYNIKRYNKAMKEGFYLEALLLDYAMLEDRLRSFLYHMGLFKNRFSHKADSDKAKKSLRCIIEQYKRSDENDYFNVNTISGKLKIIRCTMEWAESENANSNDKYIKVLRAQYDKYIDTVGVLHTISEIEKWCKYRNEIIHSLLNKNTKSAYEKIESLASEGMRLSREMDNYVKYLKTGNRIRRSLNLANK